MQGGTGDDRLVGKKGNNHLLGGDGNDILIGGNGKDLLVGGKGNDILFGMKGSKVMRGGEGSDIFVLGRGRGMNVVKDFHADEGDKLALPKGLSFDKLSFTQVGQNTMIRQGDRKIALLIGVKSSSVGIDDFVSKPPSTQSPLTPPSTLTPPPSPPV
jgi:Ca2+-binding RTX toxin-like protein